ncbi:MAG TPA: hypothetical protein VHZ55_22900 [Bryobacteraceae bacterium]|jgi:hypothetical protein|nr:hypothetical protein [Bryobacteraceae bacterium]
MFDRQFDNARRIGKNFGEAGAWALSHTARCSTAAVNIALMTYALAEWLGAGLCVTTATTRHHSALILKRLGGKAFANFEPYYEPMFECFIELLQFETACLHHRYLAKLEELRAELRHTPIICPLETEDLIQMSAAVSGSSYLPMSSPQYAASLQ